MSTATCPRCAGEMDDEHTRLGVWLRCGTCGAVALDGLLADALLGDEAPQGPHPGAEGYVPDRLGATRDAVPGGRPRRDDGRAAASGWPLVGPAWAQRPTAADADAHGLLRTPGADVSNAARADGGSPPPAAGGERPTG